MIRVVVVMAMALVACAKPEPDTSPVGEAPAAVVAPEVEQVEYVDPLEAARAAQASKPGDESWREGFDHRAPPSEGDSAEGEAAQPGSPAEQPEQPEQPGPAVEAQPAAPPKGEPPSFSEPLPVLEGVDPKSEAERHPPDAQPPPR